MTGRVVAGNRVAKDEEPGELSTRVVSVLKRAPRRHRLAPAKAGVGRSTQHREQSVGGESGVEESPADAARRSPV